MKMIQMIRRHPMAIVTILSFIAASFTLSVEAVEVAVTHKFPVCGTILVIGFLVAVCVSIMVCADSMQKGRRRLRGETFAHEHFY